MFTNWDDSLDIDFDNYDSNDYLEDTHSPFYLERAIMNFHNDNSLDNNIYANTYDSSNSMELKRVNTQRKEDPSLIEDWHYIRKIIHNEDLWPHLDELLINTPEWAICNVCSEILKHPLKWIQCEHSFCKDCIYNLIKYEHHECPVCLRGLPKNFKIQDFEKDDNLIRRIGKLKARCRWSLKLKRTRKKKEHNLTGSLGSLPNVNDCQSPTIQSFEEYLLHYSVRNWVIDKNGCKDIIKLSNLVQHHLECKYRPVICKHKDCNSRIPYYRLEEHMTDCIYQIIQCENCLDSFPLHEKELHIQQCPKEGIQCRLCHSTVQRQDINHHIQTDCPIKIIPCPHYIYGCKYECSREKMKEHLNACTFETMKDFIKCVTRRLDECEKIIRAQKEKIQRLEWKLESENIDNGDVHHRILSRIDSSYDDYYSQDFF